MSRPDIEPLRDIIYRVFVRYLTVRPGGFELGPGRRLEPVIDARILAHGAARTLYQDRKPTCRSLDGLQPIVGDTNRLCSHCDLRASCTPQVRLDLMVERRPYRLLLAYSSARAFLLYEGELRRRRISAEDVDTTIVVVDRGSWGELRFRARD